VTPSRPPAAAWWRPLEQFDGGELRLEFQETPLVARFHQLMNEPGRGEEGDGKAALTSGEAER
jgi:hypothetical protein